LWKSLDGVNWARFHSAIDQTFLAQKQILSDVVYTAILDERDTIPRIWLGTPDGIAVANDIHGFDWSIIQAEYDSAEVYAYPNPFSPLTHNQLEGDGYVRFHTGPIKSDELNLDIFSFSMEKVYHKDYDLNFYRGAIKWNGRGQNGNHVANGVYFARLRFSSALGQSPTPKWTKVIVVK
jgi:hypothetical protein